MTDGVETAGAGVIEGTATGAFTVTGSGFVWAGALETGAGFGVNGVGVSPEKTPSRSAEGCQVGSKVVEEDEETKGEYPSEGATPRVNIDPARTVELARLTIKMPRTTAFATAMRGPPCSGFRALAILGGGSDIVIRHAEKKALSKEQPEAGMAETDRV